ncbi:quinol dehydrogenase ferredoxin subunit NapH [Uliginosibacterium sp. TH139]|uniref:quinol dehydrogenase ferredoxin subunit NapH n=1 Tax=Uliginosibacterium sp. TH139 TaxID=2067453 RepID=UPI000C7D1755|nr:quinol dehydrogenase ferredoxin subunit NapH [Uliginosibacterium sp. TH139]PLK49451.1 quinol dehydrogenase ferredoxin subunit NapH [Uliginosibacterium sp. TH139]
MSAQRPGLEAIADKGWFTAHKWLLLRRASQLLILAAFLAGPWFGGWLVKGNLASSLTLDVLPLTDPFLFLQMLATRHWPEMSALIGVAIVLGFNLLVGGRVFCSWVCPMNVVTDSAGWLRRRLGLKGGRTPHDATRLWLLGFVLLAAALTGSLVWEWVNPVSMLQRGLIFGFGAAWVFVAGVFLYDLLLAGRGWCGHVCPMGALYGLIGKTALLRVSAHGRSACNDCMDCFAVCPEPQVIRPALKPRDAAASPLILDGDCTNCGRCIDVCSQEVFRFGSRFNRSKK